MTALKNLLDLPELGMRLRTGAGLLDREVSRIYGTELPDPSRYLSAGELVLTGLLWWRGPGDAEPFVAALAKAGSAALAASGADSDGIPAELVQACARHRIPLLEVPPDLSFAVITERVVLALAAERGGARRRLLSTATDDASLPALLRHGAVELGAPCWVLSGTGRVVAGTGEALPAEPAEIVTAFADRGREHPGCTVLPVGGRFVVPWLLVVGAEAGDWTPTSTEIAEELAGLAGLARGRAEQVRRVADRVAEPLLRLLAAGSAPGTELAAAFASTGLPEQAVLRVLLARAADDAGRELLSEILAEVESDTVTTLIGTVGEDAYALVVAEHWPADWTTGSAAALSIVEPLLPSPGVVVGVGGPVTMAGLLGAAQEARHAAVAGARRAEPVAVVAGAELEPHQLLIAGLPDELRRSVRERVLGPLLAYDLAQNSDLVHTVRVFLEHNGSPALTAKALHVHVNTLRYRISRASELLGIELTEFANQVDVYLALKIED
ncbi:PucR family transcriptional regulator [Amycolatopsis nigrescens]|uniref:PucR family transcriptional regulator n=1 Tax=Amycolatopsis nigrescens TaxID=381445 RepID=UPI0003702319|nr:PucR family transcriptional regulator [Amycolatopsis nigrescens]